MSYLIKNGTVYTNGIFKQIDIYVDDNGILCFADDLDIDAETTINAAGLYVLPGFIDPHVHLREPGFEYKETILSGTRAAARGGYTTIMAMPNVSPVPDSVANIQLQKKRIKETAKVHVLPYGSITVGQQGKELVDIAAMAKQCIAFSDDGKGIQSATMMKEAMQQAKQYNRMIVAHCEEESELIGGCIHQGSYAQAHGFLGINSASEWKQIKRDIQLAKETGCQYHICHISTKEGVELVRQAKKEGLHVSAEVTVHHLLLHDGDLKEDGNYKMNPPLRDRSDQEALLLGLQDGTIEIIATDHAPHSVEEKNKGLLGSAMGIVGLETAFSLLYTNLVKTKKISLEKLIDCMSYNVANLFGMDGGDIELLQKANLTIVDLVRKETIDPSSFLSKGHNTPFEGWNVNGIPVLTMVDGKIVYQRR